MIIVISDVHLGDEKCNRESFQRFVSFLAKQEIEHLVLLGDVLDFWRRSARRSFQIWYSSIPEEKSGVAQRDPAVAGTDRA